MNEEEKEGGPGVGAYLVLLLLGIIWGSSFILMKRGMFDAGRPTLLPEQVAALRLFIAWLTLLPVSIVHWRELRNNWKPLMAVGVFGNGIPAFLFTTAQTRIDSALSGMLNSSTPVFALLIGVLFFGIQWKWIQVVGILVGLVASIGLIWSQGAPDVLPDPKYASLAVLATICYGLSVNVVKNHLQRMKAPVIAALALSFAGIPAACYLLSTDITTRLTTDPAALRSVGYVSLLAVFGTAIALVMFNRLVNRTTALFASTVTYLIPVVAILWGVLDGESVSIVQLSMIAVILMAIYTVNRGNRYTGRPGPALLNELPRS